MKKQLLSLLLFTPFLNQAQLRPFAKISPTFFILTNKEMGMFISPAVKNHAFGGFVTGGLILNRYIASGVTCGYFKPIDFKFADVSFNKPVIPVGLDFTIMDFNKKKIKPLIQLQAMLPIHKQTFQYTDASGNDMGNGKISGTLMLGLSGGLAIPVFDKRNLLITGGYSSMTLKNNTTSKSNSTGIVTISVSIFI